MDEQGAGAEPETNGAPDAVGAATDGSAGTPVDPPLGAGATDGTTSAPGGTAAGPDEPGTRGDEPAGEADGSGAGRHRLGEAATERVYDLGSGGRPDEGGAKRQRWTRRGVVAATAMAAIGMLTLATVVQSPSASAGADSKPGPTTTPPATTPAATPSTAKPLRPAPAPSTTTPKASPSTSPATDSTVTHSVQDTLRKALDALPDSDSGHYSVAVTELGGEDDSTVATYDSGDDTTYDTASIVKVDILASLLLQAQKAGTKLSDGQRDLATRMIEQSDNDAALALWEAIGSGPGLQAANKALGLGHTTPGSGELWGLTQTTAADQITLLQQVFNKDESALSTASQDYMADLMGSITAGQRWGVSAADSDDSGYELKNGWLPRSATGLWDINSIGKVEHNGHTLLIAVLSSGHQSEQTGISLIERVAEAAAKAIAPDDPQTQ